MLMFCNLHVHSKSYYLLLLPWAVSKQGLEPRAPAPWANTLKGSFLPVVPVSQTLFHGPEALGVFYQPNSLSFRLEQLSHSHLPDEEQGGLVRPTAPGAMFWARENSLSSLILSDSHLVWPQNWRKLSTVRTGPLPKEQHYYCQYPAKDGNGEDRKETDQVIFSSARY